MPQESFRSISFSLAQLLGAIAVIAMFIAAIVSPDGIWSAFWQLFVFGVLAYAVLSVIYSTGASRAFWIGFALFGWGLFFVEQLEFRDQRARFTPLILEYQQSIEALNEHFTSRATASLQGVLPPGTNVRTNQQFQQRFYRLHSMLMSDLLLLLILVFAAIGGLFGLALQKSQQKKQNKEPTG